MIEAKNKEEESDIDVMDLVGECEKHVLEVVGPDEHGNSKAVCMTCGYQTDL